jgi:serine/threonine-protein kinase
MSESPPAPLVNLLGELGLALPAEIESVAGRAGRLARGLPAFEQVWVDALAQARLLTFFQAAEINSGRGRQLGLGPLVLCEPLEDVGYAGVYRARERDGGRPLRVYVLRTEAADAAVSSTAASSAAASSTALWNMALAELVRKHVRADHPAIRPVEQFGVNGNRFWIACPHAEAQTLAQWLLNRGRMPPLAVHELARQLVDALAVCHEAGIAHGDLGPRQLLIDRRGQLVLPMPGIRPIVRPGEGFAAAALAPEAYDYLSPQRIAEGTPPDLSADIYACGALWWHLLAGRPPIAGATGLAKMRAALTARIPPIGPIAPDADPGLMAAIDQCLARNPAQRPQSFTALASMLGEERAGGRRALARCALFPGRDRVLRAPGLARARRMGGTIATLAAAVAILTAVAAWPYWSYRLGPSRQTVVSAQREAWISRAADMPTARAAQQQVPRPMPAPSPVVRATYEAPIATAVPDAAVLELPAAARAAELALRPGVTVRPRSGRAAIEIDGDGWAIAVEGVTFENIDFVCGKGGARTDGSKAIGSRTPVAGAPGSPTPAVAAMLQCQVSRIRFSGCSWQLPKTIARLAAVQWHPPAETLERLEAAELGLDDCLFREVSAAVQVAPHGTLAIDIKNSLHLGPGPLVRLEAAPEGDERLVLAASHLTLRDCDGLLECPAQASGGAALGEAGSITIRAESCALVPRSASGLLVFAGDNDPAQLLAALRWLGQGSVVATDIPLAVWLRPDGRRQAALEDAVHVAGLVRSSLGFAGDRGQGAEASRVVRWQVPLQSADPPGILETRLPASAQRH